MFINKSTYYINYLEWELGEKKMRLFCRTEKWKPLISDRERKVQWIVVLRRTDLVRGISVDFFFSEFPFFSGPGHFTGSTYLPKRFVCVLRQQLLEVLSSIWHRRRGNLKISSKRGLRGSPPFRGESRASCERSRTFWYLFAYRSRVTPHDII